MAEALFWLIMLVKLIQITSFTVETRPHIVYILSDDMGWNDIGFTGRSDLQTPNIDALAYHGRILTQHYALPTCTPSRAALYTGKYPIHTGMQGYPISPSEPRALPLYERLMPQYFKDLGYQTHLVGKWHLGHYEWKYTPTVRKAFDTHFGYYNGFIGYFDHNMTVRNMSGHDFWRGVEPQYHLRGRYVTDLLTEESVRLIKAAATADAPPLFLVLAHEAPHAGNPGDHDLEYHEGDLDRFIHIADERRRKYAAMVWNLDKSVGQIVESLAENEMLNNTIIVFASDNGAQTVGMYANSGSNFPLRGLKFSVYEGAVRTVAAVWSPQLHAMNYGISQQLFHISDWLPTLYSAAGGNLRELTGLDGRDQWSALLSARMGNEESDEFGVRKELLVNIDEVMGQQAMRYRQWKFLKGAYKTPEYDSFRATPTNGENDYKADEVLSSMVSLMLAKTFNLSLLSVAQVKEQRRSATLRCMSPHDRDPACVDAACLFDIRRDPCETVNLAQMYPEIVKTMASKIATYNQHLKPQLNLPNEDQLADPKLHNGTWQAWHGDSPVTQQDNQCASE